MLHTTASDNIFLFWSGHGSDNGGPLWGEESSDLIIGAQNIYNVFQQMHSEQRYRRVMLTLESCYSGLCGEAFIGLPDILVLTAANAYETSKADIYDHEMKTFLSNAFSRSFLRTVSNTPNVTLHDLYYELARTTSGSHVTLYNLENYGSVISNTMGDYFQK